MVERVAEAVSAPPQSPPDIKRETVQVAERDAQGKPTGKMVDAERVTGNVQYATFLVPPGKRIGVDVKADDAVIGDLGPWMTQALAGRNAIVQVRVVVRDDSEMTEFPKAGE